MENWARSTFVLLALVAFAVSTESPATNTPVTATTPTAATTLQTTVDSAASNASNKPIQLELYYEALCIDSVNFVKNQLIPLDEKFYQYIDVTYIPFAQGNISTNNNITIYTCRRNQPECDADRVHACAIDKITDKNKILKFVNCALIEAPNNLNNSNELIKKCGNQIDINENIISTITNCVSTTTESNKLLDNYFKLSTNITNVPTIIINKNYTEENQKEALVNFKKVACRYIPDSSNLEECKTAAGGSSTVIVSVLPILTSVYYIINMF